MNLLQPGTQLDGRYEVVRLLGQGGMAAVYQVRHLGLHSTHALKVLNADLARSDDIRGRFLAEGRIQARMRHPHIVQVTEIVTTPVAGLVMDYIEGPTLSELCRGQGLEPQVLLEVFLPVLDAIEEAHKHHVVHRDLKPDNIIIGRDNRGRLQPKVTDFGIAKLLGEGTEGKARTQATARIGTLLYMSPEQIRGAAEVDARTDIFALGAILYEAATGRIAFHAESEYDTMKRIVEGTFEPPERVVGGLPPVIAGCIRKALAVDPAERFQDCAAFREALEKALEPEAQVPSKPSRSYGVTQVGRAPVGKAPATPAPAARSPEQLPDALAATYVPAAHRAPANTGRLVTPAPPAAPRGAVPPVAMASPRAAPLPMPTPHQMMGPPRQPGVIAPSATSSTGLALALSLFCFAGLGQVYNKQVAKGLTLLVLTGLLAATTDMGFCGAVVLMNVLCSIDAYTIATKRKNGRSVGAWEFF